MKNLTITILLILILTAGCAKVKLTLPGGAEAEYVRWFNQKIGDFTATVDPNRVWSITFSGQESETEAAFRLGRASVGVGGGR